MKQILLFILFICIAPKTFGQAEFSGKFKAIPLLNIIVKPKKETTPPIDLPKNDPPKIVAPNILNETNIFNTKPKVDNSFEMGVKKPFSMTSQNNFVNPGDIITDRMNKKPANNEGIVYRRNLNLGDFKTKSLTAKVSYRDYGEVDGDDIRVLLNDKTIIPSVTMEGYFQGFEIKLLDGFNKIDFVALNQGALGPNTAEFQIFDDRGNLISASKWDLATGFKATIVITKEK
jgi:hypothetical protein